MSYVHEEAKIEWYCDSTNCNANDSTLYEFGVEVRYQMPADWCGVLMTSMSDGDYALLLCPSCSGAIKDKVTLPDAMHNPNNSIVGW